MRNYCMATTTTTTTTLLLLFLGRVGAIYPDDHWIFARKIVTDDNLVAHARREIDAGRTLFVRMIASPECACATKQAPTWNNVTRLFAGVESVSFGEVNLQEVSIYDGPPHNPGKDGWPTIRYFNEKTGVLGDGYTRKTTSGRLCDELADIDYMIDFVEEYSDTKICGAHGVGCDERALKYIEKMKKLSADHYEDELYELDEIETTNLREDALDWIRVRRRILRQLLQEEGVQWDEL